jgi:hypothetical protein
MPLIPWLEHSRPRLCDHNVIAEQRAHRSSQNVRKLVLVMMPVQRSGRARRDWMMY